MKYKVCAKCHEEKSLDQFYLCKPKNSTPFYYFMCKGCKNKYACARRKFLRGNGVAPVKAKKRTSVYVSKVWPIAGDTPAQAAAKFLDSEYVLPKAILRKDDRFYMASAKGRLPAHMELIGIFDCYVPYCDLVQEMAA